MTRILVLAHREELIWQAVGHARNAGLTAGVEMGSHRAGREEVIVSTVQTLNAARKCKSCVGGAPDCPVCLGSGRAKRMTKFDPNEFGYVITDEGHHGTAKSYRAIYKWFQQNPNLKLLFVTATPKRADGDGLHNVCDSVAYEMSLPVAIDEGWLCPIRQRFVTVDGLDLSQVKTKAGGDLADGELERAFLGTDEDEERLLHAIAKPMIDQADGQQGIVFAAGCEHAAKLTAAFNAYDHVRAELILGSTNRDVRRDIIERYKAGDTNFLINVGVATEGFDCPAAAVIGIARPTKSESLYCQMIGRGTRPLPGVVDGPDSADERRAAIAASGKPHCIVLDFVGNSGQHKLVSVADVLAGADVDPIDLAEAVALAKNEADPQDMEELIAKAKQAREEREEQELERQRKREEARQKRLSTRTRADRADYTATDVDLFGGERFEPSPRPSSYSEPATVKQVRFLAANGIHEAVASQWTKKQASAVISKMKSKLSSADFKKFPSDAPATEAQVRVLQKFGFDSNVSAAEAARIITEDINRGVLAR